jgi:hypothetical protein
MSSWHAHACLHWPKLSAAHNTNGGPANAIIQHLRRFSGQSHAPYSACAHQPNCRFNADKNAPHFCRLTWALGHYAQACESHSSLATTVEPKLADRETCCLCILGPSFASFPGRGRTRNVWQGLGTKDPTQAIKARGRKHPRTLHQRFRRCVGMG